MQYVELARVQGDQVSKLRRRRRTGPVRLFGRLAWLVVGSAVLAVVFAPSAMADDRPIADTNAAPAFGPDVLGLPLFTILWLVSGVLAAAVGLAAASRQSHRTATAVELGAKS
jgi:hypothetical protein